MPEKILEDNIFFKILIIIIIIIFVYLYLYSKIRDSFTQDPISTQLLSQIALTLGISVRRITNLQYAGDITTQKLAVSFTILDANAIEMNNGEPNTATVVNNAMNLFNTGTFIVTVNSVKINLSRTNVDNPKQGSTQPGQPLKQYASYFNNPGLPAIAKYSNDKYRMVSNDPALTHFFKLGIDNSYNIKPVLE